MARKVAKRGKAKKVTKKTTKKATKKTAKKASGDLIISKSRTKAAAGINVSGEFYGALDAAVRNLIKAAEERAVGNKRKTLKGVDL